MERLTEVINGVVVYVGPEHETPQGSLPIMMNSKQVKAVLKKLAAYEDTGLTPEDLKAHFTAETLLKLCGQLLGIDSDRLRELAEADKDGRMLVLPCKVGDTVFLVVEDGRRICECKVEYFSASDDGCSVIAVDKVTGWAYGAMSHPFGKTVFLTREEAEAALKEAAHDKP